MTMLRSTLLILVVAAAQACGGSAEAPAPSPPAEPAVDPVRDNLVRVRTELVRDRGVAEANALNAPGSIEVLERLDRQLAGLAVGTRIPSEPDVSGLLQALTAYSKEHGLTLADFTAEERAPVPRELPEVLRGAARLRYEPDDLRGVLAVRFSLQPLDIGRLEPWLEGLPRGIGRMLLVREVRGLRDRLQVDAEAWWFLPEKWPRHEPAPRPLEAYLADAGLLGEPSELRRNYPEIWSEIERLHAEMLAFSPAVEQSLTRLSRANLLESRFELFTQKAKEIEALELPGVLR